MKTSAVLASLLFGSVAVAAPFDKRALVYKTEVVTETVVVYTTVWDDDAPVAEATTTPAGYFYEVPKAPSSAPAKPTQAPANTPAAEKPSSVYVAPAPQAPTTTTAAAATSAAPVVEQPKESPKPVEQPKPTTTTSAYVAPVNTPAPAPVYTAPSTPSTGGSGGMEHTGVDITIYDNTGAAGACGKSLTDDMMVVALAKDTWGASTYDVMTGEATNPWCGQEINIEYNGNHIKATIMDLCPGCSGADIDLSAAAWKALTKLDEKTRLKASWSKAS